MSLFKLVSKTLVAATCLVSTMALAEDFPKRPINMVLGYAAGGPTDVIARVVAKEMGDYLGQPVIVENKPGASAHIATNDVMTAKPDGYKVLVSSLTLTVSPLLYPDRFDYDAVTDLKPVSNFVSLPMVVVTGYDSPYKELQDLINEAKEKPGDLTYGSSGFGGSAHLAAEMLTSQADIEMTHIPFTGNGPALLETMAGRLSFMFYPSIGIAEYVAGDKVRVLAVGTNEPNPDFPGVPTLSSLGFEGFSEGAPFVGMLAPAGTPDNVVAKLNEAAVAALSSPA